jgi:hypothetical protein
VIEVEAAGRAAVPATAIIALPHEKARVSGERLTLNIPDHPG